MTDKPQNLSSVPLKDTEIGKAELEREAKHDETGKIYHFPKIEGSGIKCPSEAGETKFTISDQWTCVKCGAPADQACKCFQCSLKGCEENPNHFGKGTVDQYVVEAMYNTKVKIFQTKDFIQLDIDKILYWMPLPEPPETIIVLAQFDEPCPHCGKLAVARFKGMEDEFWEHQTDEADKACNKKREGN